MLEHIVLFKPKAQTTPEQEDELVRRLLALRDQIPDIVDISAGRTITDRSQGYRLGLVVRFRDKEGLDRYGPHPAHQQVVAFVKEIADDLIAVDYEFDKNQG